MLDVLREDADDDVAVGQDSDRDAHPVALVDDDERADVLFAHPANRVEERLLPMNERDVTRSSSSTFMSAPFC